MYRKYIFANDAVLMIVKFSFAPSYFKKYLPLQS